MLAIALQRLVLAILAMAVMASALAAQEDKKEPAKPKWEDTDHGQAVQWSVGMIGPNPFLVKTVRIMAADDRAGIAVRAPEWKFVFTEPLPISYRHLDAIEDGRPLPPLSFEKGKPRPEFFVKRTGPDWAWYSAFNAALGRSDEATDLDMFKKAAARNATVDYAGLKKAPKKYRGKIITVTGKLTKIRKEPAPPLAPETVESVYYCSIVGSSPGAPPYEIAFTELPAEFKLEQDLNLNVTFQGYFLSLVRYPKDDKKKEEADHPYLVGKTFIINLGDDVFPLDRRFLDVIKDGRPLPDLRVMGQMNSLKPIQKPLPDFWENPGGPDWGWYNAFSEALWRSHEGNLDRFKKSAKANEFLVYSHLKNESAEHRGKVVTVTGKVNWIKKHVQPRGMPDEFPDFYYTAAIVGPSAGAPPFAVAFTELPKGVKKENEKLDLEVTFHGYFLSTVALAREDKEEAKKHGDLLCAYLVGKTLIVNSTGKAGGTEQAFSYYLIAIVVGGIVLTAFLVAAVNVWFRRGDRKIQAQLKEMRAQANAFDLEPADPEPPPSPETGIKPPDSNPPQAQG